MVVIAQAAPLVVDDPFEFRQPLGEGQKFVDLFLVLDRGKARVGMGEHKGDFVGARVGVNRHRDSPNHLRRHHRPVELGPVRAHDGHGVTALEAEAGEPGRICAHPLQDLIPGPDLPDAENPCADTPAGPRNGGHFGSGAWGTCPRAPRRSPRQFSRSTAPNPRGRIGPRRRSPAACCQLIRKWAWAEVKSELTRVTR